MEALSHEFAGLYEEVKKVIAFEKGAQQILVILTSKSNMYHFANHDIISGDIAEEDHFLQMLKDKNDTEIKYIICMWDNFVLDVPSQHFRDGLTQINSLNKNTKVLLQGNQTWITKELLSIDIN